MGGTVGRQVAVRAWRRIARAGGRAASRLALTALLGWAGSAPVPARADEFHYQSLLVGQRAIGLGGAFTGLADDASAAFYNPGALARLLDDGVSISLSVNAFDRRIVEDGLVSSIGTANMVHDGSPTVPVSATAMLKLGKKDPDGVRPHAVAFSTFTRDREDSTFRVSLAAQLPDEPGVRRGVELASTTERTELWYGPSYAYRVRPNLAFGLSAFFSVLRKDYDFLGTLLQGAADGPVGEEGLGFSDPRFVQVSRSIEEDIKRLCMRVGGQYEPRPDLRLGLMIQTPTLHLGSRGSMRVREIGLVGADNGGNFYEAKRSLTAKSPDSWEVRVGLAYRVLPWLAFSVDGAVYAPTGSASHPVRSVKVKPSDDPNAREPGLGNAYMQTWYRRATGNVSLGMRTDLGPYVDLYTGFFTDMSSAPRIKATSYSYTKPDVNHLGASFSLALRRNRYRMSAGATALWGSGYGYAFDLDSGPDEAPLSRTVVKDRTFYVFISGYTSVVTRAVEQGYEKIQQRRGDDDAAAEASEKKDTPAQSR